MAHSPPKNRREPGESVASLALAVLGVVVVGVSVYAVRNPGQEASASVPAPTVTKTQVVTSTAPAPTAPRSSGAKASATSTARPTPTVPKAVQAVPVVVLNNTTTKGLAADVSWTLQQAGWTVGGVGNLSTDVTTSTVYYDASVPMAAQAALAVRSHLPGIKRTAPKWGGMPEGPVLVVLSTDWR